MDVRTYLQENILLLDGGTGTLLQAAGLPLGELPERWNLTHAEEIVKIHRAYFDAGSNVVCTNTFGANTLKFTLEELETIVAAAVENARRGAMLSNGKQEKFIALDIGPLGKLLNGVMWSTVALVFSNSLVLIPSRPSVSISQVTPFASYT